MLTVDEYGRIRIAHRDGMSIREIAQRYGHSRRKIRQVLRESEPRPYTLRKERTAPRLGSYRALIDQILADDEQAPRKQRHTAAKLYRRLRDEEGYVGGYDQVRRYVAKQRQDHRETFIPLTHPPGRRLEADFGHIYVDFPDGRQQVSVLLLTWSYSGFRFAVALPSERTEAILAGMVEGFAFFGCVPLEVWWDNPKTVATAILKGRQRQLHTRYEALASHYRFDPRFCMPARGNEKSYVENSVPRRWAFSTVTVKAYVDRIDVVSGDGTIASHRRSYTHGEWIVEPRDYLAILGRRPAALDHSFVFDRWALPACFEQLRVEFETGHGPMPGVPPLAPGPTTSHSVFYPWHPA